MPLEHDVVPELLSPGDPLSGDEVLFRAGSYASYQLYGGVAPPATVTAWERALHAACVEVLQGARPWSDPELAEVARALRVDHPIVHDRRPPRVATRAVPDDALADATEDVLPDCGVTCERVLGAPGAVSVLAAAVLAFVPFDRSGRRPIDWWTDEEPDRTLAVAARVVDASTPGLFRDGVSTLPRPSRLCPDPATAPPGVVVGRPYRVGDGWAWSCVAALPRVPDPDILLRRLRLELWRERTRERRMTFEDLLRHRPEVLYRAAFEATC